MYSISKNKFWITMIPAMVIIGSVIYKNGGDQYRKAKPSKNEYMIGLGTFILGWFGVVLALSFNSSGTSLRYNNYKMTYSILASLGIVVGTMLTARDKHRELPVDMLYTSLFVISWIALGYISSMNQGPGAMMFGLSAAVCIIAAMLVFLPWQRKNNVVDGPGMVLFALGWTFLAMANSILVVV